MSQSRSQIQIVDGMQGAEFSAVGDSYGDLAKGHKLT